MDTPEKPYTCTYCKKPTAQPPHHLPVDEDGAPARYMPSCCFKCAQGDRWDAKLVSEAATEELALLGPVPTAPLAAADTDEMQVGTASDLEVKCPCGSAVAVSDGKHPAVLHEMPQCQDFKSRDALTYLRWLNDQLAAAGSN